MKISPPYISQHPHTLPLPYPIHGEKTNYCQSTQKSLFKRESVMMLIVWMTRVLVLLMTTMLERMMNMVAGIMMMMTMMMAMTERMMNKVAGVARELLAWGSPSDAAPPPAAPPSLLEQ